jgi:hypothetical protein
LRAVVCSKDFDFCDVEPRIRRVGHLKDSISTSKRALKHARVACGSIKKWFYGIAITFLVLSEVGRLRKEKNKQIEEGLGGFSEEMTLSISTYITNVEIEAI